MSIDAHHHFWNLVREPQSWMTAEHAAISRTFEPADLEPLLEQLGIEGTVLVQAACTDSDTDAMFGHALDNDWIRAVVAWVDLLSPGRTAQRLDELAGEPRLRGIRHLIHDEPDPHWILRPDVLESIALLEERGLVLELPCVFPHHLGDVPELAARFPRLAIVIDHLGKPPLRSERMRPWEDLLRTAAESANVSAKISGLNTMVDRSDWSAADLRRPVEVAYDCFGADRLLCGSDWPVALLNGDYATVWQETVSVVEAVAPGDAERILAGTARELYRIEREPAPTPTRPSGGTDGSTAH